MEDKHAEETTSTLLEISSTTKMSEEAFEESNGLAADTSCLVKEEEEALALPAVAQDVTDTLSGAALTPDVVPVGSLTSSSQLTGKKRSRNSAGDPAGSNNSNTASTAASSATTTTAAAPILTYNALLALLYPSSSLQQPLLLLPSSSGGVSATGATANIAANATNVIVTSSSTTAMTSQQLQLNMIPDALNITNVTNKALNDVPPYVHLSTRDANQTLIKMLDHSKLSLHFTGTSAAAVDLSSNASSCIQDPQPETTTKWALGYRMIRASHGISPPPPTTPFVHYYYELLVASPQPTCAQIKAGLPKNTRIGYGLTKELNLLFKLEQHQLKLNDANNNSSSINEEEEEYKTITERIHETTNGTSLMLGSHLRLGYSMRTGDLNAPVGYDKWSYGVRDVRGSRIHQSKREDNWGRGYNVSFGPADVIGCWITLVHNTNTSPEGGGENMNSTTTSDAASTTPNLGYYDAAISKQQPATANQIRFFCNGKSMGALDVVGKTRLGGEAFDNITSGTYYPAISTYMGGSARANFGPHFIYNPKQGQLPSGRDWNATSNLRPVSELCPPPPTVDEAVAMALKGRNFGKKTEETVIEKFKEAVRTESGLRREAWEKFLNRHLQFVKAEREIRGISTDDLPPLPAATVSTTATATATATTTATSGAAAAAGSSCSSIATAEEVPSLLDGRPELDGGHEEMVKFITSDATVEAMQS